MTSVEPPARSMHDLGPDDRDNLPQNVIDPRLAPIHSPVRVKAPYAVRTRRLRSRQSWVALILCGLLPVAGITTAVVIKLDLDATARAEAAAQAMYERAVVLDAAVATDRSFLTDVELARAVSTGTAVRQRARASAVALVQEGRTAAAAAPNAGEEKLAALDRAVTELESSAERLGQGTSPLSVQVLHEPVSAASQVAQEAQAAWQAEQDRLAAEAAAAAEAARAAAARQAANSNSARQSTTNSPRTTGSSNNAGGGGSAPAATGQAQAPAATTGSAWAAGVQAYGGGGLGAVINQRRAEAGLNALSVVGSTSLQNHAAEMAAAGSIWHSGRDHIVGWVSPISDTYMIQAYLNSPAHRAWVLKAGVSRVAIGAVTYNGRLYTAMVFS